MLDYIARYFPRYRAYIGRGRRMGFELGPVSSGPYPGDRIRSRTATEIRLTTPAGQRCAGAAWWLAPDRDPVESLIILDPAGDMGVTDVKARLPRNHGRPCPGHPRAGAPRRPTLAAGLS